MILSKYLLKMSLLLLIALFFSSCNAQKTKTTPSAPVEVIAEGLNNPLGLAQLPDGGILIAEEGTGERDLSAGVSLLTTDGDLRRVISQVPSSRDSGDLSGMPLVAVSPDGQTVYAANFGAGHLWTLPVAGLATLDDPYTPDTLGRAMNPLNSVQLSNPFDMTFDKDGVPVVTDATANGVAKQTASGETRFIQRFDELPDPTNPRLKIDPVPTGITRLGERYLVTLLGGCPYPPGSGLLVSIDENRGQETLLSDLSLPIDVAVDGDGTIWVLEFARFTPGGSCFSGQDYVPQSGKLSRMGPDGRLQTMVTELSFPGAVLPLADGTLAVTELFAGRVLRLNLADVGAEPVSARELLNEPALPTPIPPPTVTPKPTEAANTNTPSHVFVEAAAAQGLDFKHGAFATEISMDPVAMMGGGLCWLDVENDGWLDLYMVNSFANAERDYWAAADGLPTNGLYHNDGGHFSDISIQSGSNLAMRGNGCVVADFDMDGFSDIFITADGPNVLLWNNGDGTFSVGSAVAGVDSPEWNSAAVVADVNGDGLPDLFVAAYIDLANKIENPSGAFPQDFYGLPDHLYLNNGDRTFRDVAAEVGLTREERGLGALFTDLNADGILELYIANDGHPNRLYSAEPTDTALGFQMIDLSLDAQTGDSGSGMGVTGGDYDGDGALDMFVTNWLAEPHALYRNDSAESEHPIHFRFSTYRIGISGLGVGVTGWGTALADFDHDGDNDLIIVNGHVPITDLVESRDFVRYYSNQTLEGKPAQFRDWSKQVGFGADGTGPFLARGSAVADFDNDGDLDVVVNQIGGSAVLLRNDLNNTQNHWLQVSIEGFYPGTTVSVTLPDGSVLQREWHAGSSYLSSEDPRLHFGLGAAQVVDVSVRLPSGEEMVEKGVSAETVLVFTP